MHDECDLWHTFCFETTKRGEANLYGIFGTTWKQKQAKSLEVWDA